MRCSIGSVIRQLHLFRQMVYEMSVYCNLQSSGKKNESGPEFRKISEQVFPFYLDDGTKGTQHTQRSQHCCQFHK
jgi:hypothetical protein